MKTWQNIVIEITCGAQTLRLETDAMLGAIRLVVVGEEDRSFLLPYKNLDKIVVALQQSGDFLRLTSEAYQKRWGK